MDDIFAAIQPGASDGGSAVPTPSEPPSPAPEATPPAPEQASSLSAEEKQDIDEWNDIATEMFPGVQGINEDKNNGQTKPETKSKETGADPNADPTAPPKAGPDEPDKADAEDKDAGDGNDDQEEAGPPAPPELSPSDRQQLEASVKAEISQKIFTEEINGRSYVTTPDGTKYFQDANGKTYLADADGDPIRTIDDVMKLVNPRTGEAFTEEQAGMFLLNAQNQMRDNIADMNNRVNEIAANAMTMKEQSGQIEWEYGELLRAMPDMAKELWDEYSKTFVTDKKTGIVLKTPVSMESWYRRALEPYALLGRQLEEGNGGQPQGQPQGQAQPQAPATPPAPDPQAAQQQRMQRRQDRSDIYGGGKVDTLTDEQKEWGAAAQAVFGDQLNDLRR